MMANVTKAVFKAFIQEAFDTEYALVKLAPKDFRPVLLSALIRKAGKFDPSKHPRGKGGHFISKDKLEDAKTDPKMAAQLRKEVRPEDREKLENVISGKGESPGRTKRGAQREAAADRKSTRLNSSHVSESRMPSSA